MFPAGHPVSLLPGFAALAGKTSRFEFSKYVYVPQSTADDREYVKADAASAAARAAELLGTLNPAQELAFHSRIFSEEGELRHVPMLDLAGPFGPTPLEGVAKLMREFAVEKFSVYLSGRSSHVYGHTLLSQDELYRFFAKALLLNLPDAPAIVDSRWIGHRLLAGYGSLRWSLNTPQYKKYPEHIGTYPAA